MSKDKKTISVVVPAFNEVSMLDEICERTKKVFDTLKDYKYELVFFDDGSTDGTREAIKKLSQENEEVKAVFYSKNFGYLKSTFYCMQQAKGDCAIMLHADLQNPPELIPEFIKKWENGAQVVLGVKNKSRENKFVYFLRTVFYYLMIKLFGVNLVPHATEFELFDRSFIDILKQIKTNSPFLRGIVLEYAKKIDCVYYTQDARKKGKTKFNLNKYYDFAICGITEYSAKLPRKIILCSVIGLIALLVETFMFNLLPAILSASIIISVDSLIIRCILGVLFIILITVSVVFEYIIAIRNNNIDKPFIIEEERINY